MLNKLSSQKRKYCLVIIIVLIAEVYLFNFRYWCTLIPDEQSIPISDISTDENASVDGNRFKLLSTENVRVFFQYSGELKSLTFATSISGDTAPYIHHIRPSNTSDNVVYTIDKFTINQRVTVFDTTGAQLFHKERVSYLSEENSMYINLPAGDYYILTEFSHDNVKLSGDAYIDSVYVNKTIPFEFNIIRFLSISMLFFFIIAFAPGSSIWTKPYKGTPVVMLAPAVVALCLFICIGVSNPIWLNKTPAVDSYGELTKALAQGHFYTDLTPSQELLQMDDPYNYELRKNVDYLLDYAYYNGKYYVYFGVVPSVLAFLPYYLITGKMLSYSLCFFFVLTLFLWGLAQFLSAYIKRYHNNASIGTYVSLYALLLLMSSINVLFYGGLNYTIPQLCGVTLLIWGSYFYTWAGIASKSDKKLIVAGSFCFALIAGCRPQLTFCALVAYPLLKDKMIKKNTLRCWLAFIMPYIIVAIPLMYYNYARFGSVADFGAYYNLTFGQIYNRQFSFAGFKSAALFYLFTIPHFSTDFPWVIYHIPDLIAENVSDNLAGYFVIFPVSLGSLFCWHFNKSKSNSGNILRILLIFLAFFMIAVSYFYLVIRYIFDFGLLLGIETIAMLLEAEQNRKYRNLIHAIILLSLVLGIVYYFLYFFSSYATNLSLDYTGPECWYRVYKAVCFWK